MEWYDENGDVWVLRPKPSGPRGRKFPQNNVSFFKISLVLVVFFDIGIDQSSHCFSMVMEEEGAEEEVLVPLTSK